MKYDVFISHSSFDLAESLKLYDYLESCGIRCFIDHKDISSGEPWPEAIVSALEESTMMVLVFSTHANDSKEVCRELSVMAKKGRPIIPFRLSDCPYQGTLHYYLSNLNWINGFPDHKANESETLPSSAVASLTAEVYQKLADEICQYLKKNDSDWKPIEVERQPSGKPKSLSLLTAKDVLDEPMANVSQPDMLSSIGQQQSPTSRDDTIQHSSVSDTDNNTYSANCPPLLCRIGRVIDEENLFIGRHDLVEKIQQRCIDQDFSIVGLPRIGKTSLAQFSILTQRDKVRTDGRLFIPFKYYVNPVSAFDFFKNLVDKCIEEIKASSLTSTDKIESANRDVVDNGYDKYSVQRFFQVIDTLPIVVVIILDEFDAVLKIPDFDGSHLALLREILQGKNTRTIIISRRSIFLIEKNYRNGPSLFSGIFDVINLKGFNACEMREYWEKLKPYFSMSPNRFDSHKKKALKYAGNHPFYLNKYNSSFFSGTKAINEEIQTNMYESFDTIVSILDEEGLLDTAIQAVIDPVFGFDQEKLQRLVSYGFLIDVPTSKKRHLLGSDIDNGYCFRIGGRVIKSYVTFSDYFTKLLYRRFADNVPFWPNWRKTFVRLRDLAQKFFVDNWGNNWSVSSPQDEVVNQMLRNLQRDVNNNVRPSDQLIDYLDEKLMRDLLDRYWETFKVVFDGFDKSTFFEYIDYVRSIRNHYAHLITGALSHDDVGRANDYLTAIWNCSDSWLNSNGSSSYLRIQQPPTEDPSQNADSTPVAASKCRANSLIGFIEGNVYEGTIVSSGIYLNVRTNVVKYDLRIMSQITIKLAENDRVNFVAKKKDNDYHWYASEVKKID